LGEVGITAIKAFFSYLKEILERAARRSTDGDGGGTNLQGQPENAMGSFKISFIFFWLVARQL